MSFLLFMVWCWIWFVLIIIVGCGRLKMIVYVKFEVVFCVCKFF